MITGTVAEYQSNAGSTNDTSYLALGARHGVSSVNICEIIDRVITAPHRIKLPVREKESRPTG